MNVIVKAGHLTLSWARLGVVYLSHITVSVPTTWLWTMAFYGKWHCAVTFQKKLLFALEGRMVAAISCIKYLCLYQNVRCHASEKAIFVYIDIFQIVFLLHSNTIFPYSLYQRPMFIHESKFDFFPLFLVLIKKYLTLR